eukprot:TRINITY_DN9058_c0_g1_i3.p1 TRINITY_DN9058_c0_g1~~TRINITY_DN9058_c0_g1_i3.p1  ORF type:complete len:386 (-),score=39.91 TRINITY_DN9058_c0_g1_i3:165-1232(-)
MARGPVMRGRERAPTRRFFVDSYLGKKHYERVSKIAKAVIQDGMSVTQLIREFKETKGFCKYWRNVFLRHEHLGRWGGPRLYKYTVAERITLYTLIRARAFWQPRTKLGGFVSFLHSRGFADVTPSWLTRLFQSWHWSFKAPQHQMLYKYSIENMAYYIRFLVEMYHIPWHILKYIDESSFNMKELLEDLVIGPTNVPQVVINSAPIDGVLNTTVCTTYSADDTVTPIHLVIRKDTNDAASFLEFIVLLIRARAVVYGDILVLDSAKVHTAQYIEEDLVNLLYIFNIRILFTPKYSPEVMVAEHAHNFVKGRISSNRNHRSLHECLVAFHDEITMEMMRSWYDHVQSIVDRRRFI